MNLHVLKLGHELRQRLRGPGQQTGSLTRAWTPFAREGRGAHVPAASSVPSSHWGLDGGAPEDTGDSGQVLQPGATDPEVEGR